MVHTDVASGMTVAVSVHGEGLHKHLTHTVATLVGHGNDGMLAHAVHEETVGRDLLVDVSHLVASQGLRGIVHVDAVGEGIVDAGSHEHGVATHDEVIMVNGQLGVDVEEAGGLAPSRGGLVGAEQQFALEGVTVQGVFGEGVVDKRHLTMLIDQGCLSVLLHGHHGVLVQVAVVGGDNGFRPFVGPSAHSGLDLDVAVLLKGALQRIVIVDFLADYG